jgi:mRNA-degrading endonuclease RelE of RelBE toxin-antitoxin system
MAASLAEGSSKPHSCSDLVGAASDEEVAASLGLESTPVKWIAREAKKSIKRMPKRVRERLVEALQTLEADPFRGEFKTSFPHSVRFLGFITDSVHYRLAYSVTDESIHLHAIGPHENFYDSIRRLRE